MTSEEQPSEQEVFTVAAAVVFLKGIGVEDATPWAIHQRIREGKLRNVGIGRKHKVMKEDLLAMLKNGRKARA
jgi:hypothetical protein